MKLSTRYGLAGIAALALLTAVDALRARGGIGSATGSFLLGVLPNFAAAIAIPFVMLSVWTDQRQSATTGRAFAACVTFSTLGLFAWEAIQRTSGRFVFDPHDLGATVAGALAAFLLFRSMTPRQQARTPEPADGAH